MSAIKRREGSRVAFTPDEDVAAGAGVVKGRFFGFTTGPVAAGDEGTMDIVGVFEVDKQAGAGVAFGEGDDVYYDLTNQRAVAVDGGGANRLIGLADEAAANGVSTVMVRLQPQGA